jgi:hypothetical protein
MERKKDRQIGKAAKRKRRIKQQEVPYETDR